MPEFKLLVFIDPVEGEDEAFNDWYDNDHIPETLKQRPFKTAQRFRTVGEFLGSKPPAGYLALYELEAESIEEAMAQITEINKVLRPKAPPAAVDMSTVNGPWPLVPIGPLISSET